MEWLNYHHLLYFWTVVREGGISKAAEKLRLAQPTISAQIRQLEESLGGRLFERLPHHRVHLCDVEALAERRAELHSQPGCVEAFDHEPECVARRRLPAWPDDGGCRRKHCAISRTKSPTISTTISRSRELRKTLDSTRSARDGLIK